MKSGLSTLNIQPSTRAARKRRPVMIGAHVPKKATRRPARITLCESAAMINRAFDEREARRNVRLVHARHGFNR